MNRTRLGPLLMLAAYLPALLFVDHWTLRLDIPGSDYYVGLPAERDLGHQHAGDESHSSHCHESVASCSDTRVTTGTTIAVLAAVVFALTLGGIRHRCRTLSKASPGEDFQGPEPRPPRMAAANWTFSLA